MAIHRHLFDESMEVKEVDAEGKRFDKCSRIFARNQTQHNCTVVLDYNCDIYDLPDGTKIQLVITESLETETNKIGKNEYDQNERHTLADDFEYVMHGKIFRMVDGKNDLMEVYASFGGLLMQLKGEPQDLNVFSIDQRIYLLIKRYSVG